MISSKNIMVVLGNCRRKGNTEQLAQAFIAGAEEAGHQVELVDLRKLKVSGCTGCNACRFGKPCVIKDDFNALTPKIKAADLIVFASPLHFWMLSSSIMAFIERFYNFEEDYPDYDYSLDGPKVYPVHDSALLMTAADNNFWTYSKAADYYQYAIVKYIGFHDRGMLLAGGCGDTNGAAGIKATDWLEKAREFGRTVYSEEE